MRTALLLVAVVGAFILFRYLTRGGERAPIDEVVTAIEAGAPVLDVRTGEEYAGGHVAGARNVNVFASDFRERVDDLDRDQTVYVYCASGHRSGRAAKVLEDMGFQRVVNAGGFISLAQAGAPVER